jgi:hypothetical protein
MCCLALTVSCVSLFPRSAPLLSHSIWMNRLSAFYGCSMVSSSLSISLPQAFSRPHLCSLLLSICVRVVDCYLFHTQTKTQPTPTRRHAHRTLGTTTCNDAPTHTHTAHSAPPHAMMHGHTLSGYQWQGAPGVVAERFEEAFTVRHCALSLVVR